METWAYAIAADGSATRLTLDAVDSYGGAATLLWVHVDGTDPDCMEWLRRRAGLSAPVVEALGAVETRPRATFIDGGALVNLRGVNAQPDADPDDLVSIRVWAEAGRVVSANFRPMAALADLCRLAGCGRILDPGDFIAELAEQLTIRLDPVINDLSESVDTLEGDVDARLDPELRVRIGHVRRIAIQLRRYISPQRDALNRLAAEPLAWMTEADRIHIREAADRVIRMVEELDSIRERATVLVEQLMDRRAELTNQRTLVLSVVSSIFLPLTFFTGLLGMNVEGIPYAHHPYSFWVIVGFNVTFALALVAYFRAKRWF